MIDFSREPYEHFHRLYQEAVDKKVNEPHAMTLATVDSRGQPSARIVYYKGMVRGGISFYTNYTGHKAHDIETNPLICVNFFWAELGQQIRVLGRAEKVSRAESEAYFKTRARLSQIGAWASHQSKEIPSYEYFQDQVAAVEKRFEGQEVPCPPFWGGYRLEATEFEFWFGHSGRLHERYIYQKSTGGWKTFQRSP